MDKEVTNMIPKGIAQFFNQIGNAAQTTEHKRLSRANQETQIDTAIIAAAVENVQAQLQEQNAHLTSEVDSLRRVIHNLESQIASSQDENANLSTGLEELDIQHQEAIERILIVKEDTHKELEQVKEDLIKKNEAILKLTDENTKLHEQIEYLNLELMGTETLSQENARLREKIGTLVVDLPSISEQSAAEAHVRSLEREIDALRQSRGNLERENATQLSQIRQRDANLRKMDARLEEITKEKEIKEREMTQIVFECNSFREELKGSNGMVETLQNENASIREVSCSLKNKLEDACNEIESLKVNLEASRREISLGKDESTTLKVELESLKEELGGGEAKALRGNQELEQARLERQEESLKVEELRNKILVLEEKLSASLMKYERSQCDFEISRVAMQNELDGLRDISREYGIQKDIFKEKESELKKQIGNIQANSNTQLSQALKERDELKLQLDEIKIKHDDLLKKTELYGDNGKEIAKYEVLTEDLKKDNDNLTSEISKLHNDIDSLVSENKDKEEVNSQYKLSLEQFEHDIDNYKKTIKLLEAKIDDFEAQIAKLNQLTIESNVHDTQNTENIKLLIEEEKEKHTVEIEALSKQVDQLLKEQESICNKNKELEKSLSVLSSEKDLYLNDKCSFEKVNHTLLSEVASLSTKNQDFNKQVGSLEKQLNELKSINTQLLEQVEVANHDRTAFNEKLKSFGGIEGMLSTITQSEVQLGQLSHQVNHFKDELKEAYEEKDKLCSDFSMAVAEKINLLGQIELLRKELNNIPILKEEVENLKQVKATEISSYEKEIKRLSNALSVQLSNNEVLYKEKMELVQKYEQLHVQMQMKMSNMEEIEKANSKEVGILKQETENLKTQLEYASQLLQNVERQEGEGQPSGESNSQKASSELQEEISRLTASLLKEQTDCKLLKNQLEEAKEKLEKAENQLRTLKSHLVEIQDSYSSELSAADEKLRETQTLLLTAEERARTSSTAYTSASIRANQQVEALKEQLRLLSEHKEKLEQQLSQAEDASLKQSASITRLQAVLHQFHVDKQKEVDFETERIRRDLYASEKKYEDVCLEMKALQEQLIEAKKGLAAGQRLSEELLRQSDLITQLKSEIFDLKEKLRMKEEKMNDLNSDSKVDRQLVKNLLVGYVASPVEAKLKVLGVLGQVLSLSKEERQKVGLEPGGRQQTLSEAFIKFLQSESQPRLEVILPLTVPQTEQPPSRKTSLLTPEVPILPNFTVGRNPGSILKDVLQERRPE